MLTLDLFSVANFTGLICELSLDWTKRSADGL